MADKKTTDEFLNEILTADQLDVVIEGQGDEVWNELALVQCLNALLVEKGLRRAQVIRDGGINESYGYQVFNGSKNPKRDTLLRLAFGLGTTYAEANHLLHAGGASSLYPRDKRDATIIFCLNKGYSLMAADEELYRHGMETISSAD